MSSHKAVAVTRSCVLGPSVVKSAKDCHRNSRIVHHKSNDTPTIQFQTLDSLLTHADGDLVKASRLLESQLVDTRAKITSLTTTASLSDTSEFNARLATLKTEQKRLVDLCEGLYYMSLENSQQLKKQHHSQQKTVAFRPPSARASQKASAEFSRTSLADQESKAQLSERPPSGQKPGIAGDRAWPPTQGSSESGGPEGDEEGAALRRGYQELLRSKVEAMWSDFEISNARGSSISRRRSSSLDRGDSGKPQSRKGEAASAEPAGGQTPHWKPPKPTPTVPVPFTMTLRDSGTGSATLRKSRSMLQFEEEQRRRRDEEEAACRVRFHANPVPAHVRMPLYEEMTEQQETRLANLRERSRELLKSTERPFNFEKREESNERPAPTAGAAASVAQVPPPFRANPVPPSSSSGEAVLARQRLHQEDELLRQIKIKMRSEDSLRKSATPGEMAARQQRMEETRHARLAKYTGEDKTSLGGGGVGKRQRPRSADAAVAAVRKRRGPRGGDPPDFKKLHWTFGQEMLATQQRQPPKPVTRPKPFQLRTEQRGERAVSASTALAGRSSRGSGDQRRSSIGAVQLAGSAVASTGSILGDFAGRTQRSLVRHEEAPPARLTQSAMLREARRGAERETVERRSRETKSELARREARRRQLAEAIKQSVELATASLSGPSVQERTRAKLESQREQEEAYKQRLREIDEKMKQRDLLVVQQAKLIAQQKAQAKYRKTLQEAGVDPKEVDENAKKYQEGDLQSYTQDFERDSADDYGDENPAADLGATTRADNDSASPVADDDD